MVYDSLNKRRLGLVKRQGWSSALLKDTFREAVLNLDQDQVTCFIDAMDECHDDDIEQIIQYFDNIGDALVAKGTKPESRQPMLTLRYFSCALWERQVVTEMTTCFDFSWTREQRLAGGLRQNSTLTLMG